MKRSSFVLVGVVLISIVSSQFACADVFSQLPLDKSDSQSPALISATLSKPNAPAKSADSILLTIIDDKNGMIAGNAFEFRAPPGTGTLLLSEGYSPSIGPARLTSQTITSQGIQQTWEIPFKVPSVEGLWVGYRIDFQDVANNVVQFMPNPIGTCNNAVRYEYPNRVPGSLDSIPCTFNLNLNVLPEDPALDASPSSSANTPSVAEIQRQQLGLAKTLIANLQREISKALKLFGPDNSLSLESAQLSQSLGNADPLTLLPNLNQLHNQIASSLVHRYPPKKYLLCVSNSQHAGILLDFIYPKATKCPVGWIRG